MIPMKTRIAPSGAVIAASLATVLLAACGKQEQVSEVEWAKAALARNPALEIISTDETAGTFSVRDTTTGATYHAANAGVDGRTAAFEARVARHAGARSPARRRNTGATGVSRGIR